MDDEDDAEYPPNFSGAINNRSFLAEKNASSSQNTGNHYAEDDGSESVEGIDSREGDDDHEDGDDDDGDGESGVGKLGMDDYDEKECDDYGVLERFPKKRRLKTLSSSYELVPRASTPKASHGARILLADWTEHETFILIDTWGDRFLKQGRKSLRSEEWQEVADKVSNALNSKRTDTQCRNRLDTLKKKYNKEKMKWGKSEGSSSKWAYFRKMDALLSTLAQPTGLSCGVDSGEYIFMNPKIYLNQANGLDEMRDSPGNSESGEGEENYCDHLFHSKKMKSGKVGRIGVPLKLLAESIHKFSAMYEKIETGKGQQLQELEKMRMEFRRDLETQKRRILERGHAQIAKLQNGHDEDNGLSAENLSG